MKTLIILKSAHADLSLHCGLVIELLFRWICDCMTHFFVDLQMAFAAIFAMISNVLKNYARIKVYELPVIYVFFN